VGEVRVAKRRRGSWHQILEDIEKAEASLRLSVSGAVEALLTAYPGESERVVGELISCSR